MPWERLIEFRPERIDKEASFASRESEARYVTSQLHRTGSESARRTTVGVMRAISNFV